jgi:3-dehydroquinate dehydratase
MHCSSRCTLADIEACVSSCALRMGVEVQLFQSSDLGLCVQRLQSAQEHAVVINPGRWAQFSDIILIRVRVLPSFASVS